MRFFVATPLRKTAVIGLSWVHIDHCYQTFEYYWNSLPNDSNKALRMEYAGKLYEKLVRWRNDPKFYYRPDTPNEFLVDVKISYQLAILLFEVCEYANQPDRLDHLMLRIENHLWEYFNIRVVRMKQKAPE